MRKIATSQYNSPTEIKIVVSIKEEGEEKYRKRKAIIINKETLDVKAYNLKEE